MDKITIKDILKALEIIDEKKETIDSISTPEEFLDLSGVSNSDLKSFAEFYPGGQDEPDYITYYYGKDSKINDEMVKKMDESLRLIVEDERTYARINMPGEDQAPLLQFSISNSNDKYNMVNALWGNSITSPQRIDHSTDIKAVFSEIIDKSTNEKDVENAKRALEFLDNLTEITLNKEAKKEVTNVDRNAPYYKVAKQALMNWGNQESNYVGLSEEDALKIINNESFEKIESDVGAMGSINYAFEELANEMELNEEERNELSKMVVGESKNSENIIQILTEKADGKDKDELVLNMLSAVHDGWVKDNGKKFFARDKKYQHLPLELIGWKEVKADLLFVGPIAESIGINIDEKQLEESYNKRVKQFKEDKSIETNNDLRRLISEGADFYPALKGQDDILFALSNPAFVSSFVLKENVEDVLKENEAVWDFSNPNIIEDMEKFADEYDPLSVVLDQYESRWPETSSENRYHLSTEDKQLLLKNAKTIRNKYNHTKMQLYDEVYDEERVGREDFKTVVKDNQKYTNEGVSYKEIVDTADRMISPTGTYGYFKTSEAEEIVKNEVADTQIKSSLQLIQNKEKDERKNTIKNLMTEYKFEKLSEYLSDDDLEIVAEIKEDEITANDSVINQKKDRINVLTRREQLMKKLAEQEKTLKSQESEIASLDYNIKRLEYKQEQK